MPKVRGTQVAGDVVPFKGKPPAAPSPSYPQLEIGGERKDKTNPGAYKGYKVQAPPEPPPAPIYFAMAAADLEQQLKDFPNG